MQLGEHVRVTRDIDLAPHGLVLRDATGVVVECNETTGERTILLDTHHPGLVEWSNTIWSLWPYDDEISTALEIIRPLGNGSSCGTIPLVEPSCIL